MISVQLISLVAQSCPTLCDPIDCSRPGFPVHHQLLELTQTHVHPVGDTIQLSHPLSSPALHAFNLSQHQCLFQWVSSYHQLAKLLRFKFFHQSFQWIFRNDFLQDWLNWSPCDDLPYNTVGLLWVSSCPENMLLSVGKSLTQQGGHCLVDFP